MRKFKVAILGVTGAVGQEFLKLLDERDFPLEELRPLASARSAGKTIPFRGKDIPIQEATENAFEGIDLVLSSAGGSVSRKLVPHAVKAGAVVVDNTSAFRMDPSVPLVIPEINPEDIAANKGIIANPNCSTIIMLLPVFPLHRVAKVKRIIVATYQSASGAGAQAMKELETQTREILDGKAPTKAAFPHQIAFNLFSHNSPIDESGCCEEERKMINETAKIFHDEAIRVLATTIRVPVFRAHSESIYLEFEKPVKEDEVREILSKAEGVSITDRKEENYFPMPVDASGQDDVFVGRIRVDAKYPQEVSFFVCGDQIRKGAALNAVQIAEHWARNPVSAKS